ncbi:beta/gamma crystallin domain-containing protein 1 isoform X2 [Ascaphus truei]|uniref:beta/gamma crystallin domain-containing protein 1 isoform X2 n=1 Tax=Ascaphus truei TaxID=8439 RepID=UPI003F5A801C
MSSRAQSLESPKKDNTKKPVLGKFGNLFTSNKKRVGKTPPESPTNPTTEKPATPSKTPEKELVRERKKVQVSVTTSGPTVQNQAGSRTVNVDTLSDQVTRRASKERGLPVNQSEKEITNGKSDNGLSDLSQYNEGDPSVLETEAQLAITEKVNDQPSPAESPTTLTDAFSGTSQGHVQSPTARPNKQNSTDRNVRHPPCSPVKKHPATEGETGKASTRKLQVFSSEIIISKEDSTRASPKRTIKFTSKLSDSKLRIPDKPAQSPSTTEAPNTAKLGLQIASGNKSKDPATLITELGQPQETARSSNSVDKTAGGDGLVLHQCPLVRDISTAPEKLNVHSSSESTNTAKVLTVDIYLSKTAGTNTPTPLEGYNNRDPLEKSPGIRKMVKKRKSLKSQTSQNEEKNTENPALDEPVFDNDFTFEGVLESPTTPESKVKPVQPSLEPNGASAARQDSKAGTNHKVSPKGESDKGKQQHPASSPLKKKAAKENQPASVPASPTARKAQVKDSLLRNQAAPSAKATEGNQPVVPVSTTKDACVEQGSEPGSSTCASGENSADDRKAQQKSSLGVQAHQANSKADVDSSTQPSSGLDVTENISSFIENSTSTVTSKLNIPPKPKNVELPFNPKVADSLESVQDSTTEQQINRGNTAIKISLFENKRTSHRQVDFLATKSISQPKKYIERAKLSFGKHPKGTVQKYHSATSKHTSEPKSPDNAKSEHVPSEIKAKSEEAPKAESANKEVQVKKKKDITGTLVNQMQMEDTKHDLDTVVKESNNVKESILPSLKEESCTEAPINIDETIPTDLKSFESTKCNIQVNKNNITESSMATVPDLLSKVKAEDKLSHSAVDSAVHCVENSTQLPNKASSCTNSVPSKLQSKHHTDMENVNKNISVQKESGGLETSEQTEENLSKEDTTVPLDCVDSCLPVASLPKIDPVQSNSSKEVTEKEPLTAHSAQVEDNLRTPQNKTSKKKPQSKEITNSVAKKVNQDRGKKQSLDSEQSISKVRHDLNSELTKSDENSKETLEHTKEVPKTAAKHCSDEGTHSNSPLKTHSKNDVHQPNHQESKSLLTTGSLNTCANIPSDEEGQVTDDRLLSQDVSASNQRPAISGNESNGGPQENKSSLCGDTEPRNASPTLVSTGFQESGVSLDNTSSHSPDENHTVVSNMNEIEVSPDHKLLSYSSDVKQQDTQITVLHNGTNGITLSPETAEHNVSRMKDTEAELAVDIGFEQKGQQNDNFQNTLALSMKEDKPGDNEPISVARVDQLSKNLDNIEPKNASALTKADVKKHPEDCIQNSCSEKSEITTAVDPGNTSLERANSILTVDPPWDSVSKAHQNGCVDDPATIADNNGSLQNILDLEEHLKNVQRSPESSFNASLVRDESILDSSSDMEKFAETIRMLESPLTLPQKRKKPRVPKSPGPSFGLASIREDYLEKILDSEAFSFGLGKIQRAKDLAPMSLFRMQSKETAEKIKPKRATTDKSMLLKSLSTRAPPSTTPETYDKENADVADVAVKRSRLEKSSIYSSLKLPFAARSEDNVFSPSVTSVSTISTSFSTSRKDSSPKGRNFDLKTTDSIKTAQTSVQATKVDNGDIDLAKPSMSLSQPPSNMEKYSETVDGEKEEITPASPQWPEVTNPDFAESPNINSSSPIGNRIAATPLESTPKSDFLNHDNADKDFSNIFHFKGYDANSIFPDHGAETFSGSGVEKVNSRPGKIVICSEANFGGTAVEVYTDVIDCTTWELSPIISIKTVRGCWLLYDQPNFEGRSIALEEGDLELTNLWAEDSLAENILSPTVIGSLRHVVKDYRICQIDLFTDPVGLGIMTSYFDDTEELQVYGRLQKTCSIKVHWGVWLIYEEAGFQGIPYIIEPGEYPDLSFWNTQEAYIGSMRPLKMGGRKVEIPYEPKIIIYEKALFEGRHVELEEEILTLKDLDSLDASGGEEVLSLATVGSMRVLSGLWVGYEKPGFEGHQYLLEEGDYGEWNQWGGYNGFLQSLRPILSDFSTPHMTMYSEKDFDENAPNINVLGIIANMEDTGYGVRTRSINVLSGVWVAYETPDFTGEQYILEKGMYPDFGDWGSKNMTISSVQPILLDTIENPRGSSKVQLFSEPDFQGDCEIFEGDAKNIVDSFATMSCKVISGSFAAYEKEDFSGDLYVLEEGNYPNLCAMGCQQNTAIRSLQIINYEFSEPSIVLYGKENYKGRKIKLTTETTNIQSMGYSPDLLSVEVLGGIWVVYEFSCYRGHQVFLLPSKIPQWFQFSGWNKIGSLRPLQQKQLYFKLRNKASGMLLSTNGSLDDIKLLRIQVMEDTDAEDQIWVYHKGILRCRIAEDCSLTTSGSLVTAGSKLGLSLEQAGASMHWSISPDGRIYSRTKPNLVLDIKGGNQYDQQHVILNPVTEGKLTQLWEISVL